MLDVNGPCRICVVTTTVGAMDDANRLARCIVARKLAACVQLDAIACSLYPWDGQLCAEPEVRLTIKTIAAKLPELEALFEDEHPYELPQFAACEMAASKAYGGWVSANVEADA